MITVVAVRRVACVLVACALLSGAAATGAAAPASAATTTTAPEQRQREIDAELRRLRGELAQLDAAQQRAAAELQVTRRARAALGAEVAAFDGELAAAQRELDQVSADLESAIAAQLAAQAAVDRARQALRAATEVLNEQAVQAFIKFGAKPSVGDLLSRIDDVNDAPRVVAWVEAAAERQARVIDDQRRLQRGTATLERQAAEGREAVAARRDEAARRRAEIEVVRAERAAAQASVAKEQAMEQRLLDSLAAARTKAAAEVAELQRASAAVTALLQRKQAGQRVVPVRPGYLQASVADAVVTSTFGWRVHPIFGDRRLHAGVDFAARLGAAVYAAADGTVLFAGWQSGYGYTVIIDHGGALATLYAHNSALAVAVGARVSRGQRIASVGSTGNSTGPHAHLEVRANGEPVDPLGYL